MSDLSLSEMQSFVDAFQRPDDQGRSGSANGQVNMWQGIVVSTDGNIATVNIRGVPIPGIRCFQAVRAGQTVWGFEQGKIKLLLGAANFQGGGGPALIKSVALTSDSPTLDITGIPPTYRNLECWVEVNSARATGGSDGLRFLLNGSTGPYDNAETYNNGSTLTTTRAVAIANGTCGEMPIDTVSRTACQLLLFSYADTSIYTAYTSYSNSIISGTGPWTFWETGQWRSGAQISSISFRSSTGSNLRAGSRVSVYGVPV